MYSNAKVQGPSGKVYNVKIEQKNNLYFATIKELKITVTSSDTESLWQAISKAIDDKEWANT